MLQNVAFKFSGWGQVHQEHRRQDSILEPGPSLD